MMRTCSVQVRTKKEHLPNFIAQFLMSLSSPVVKCLKPQTNNWIKVELSPTVILIENISVSKALVLLLPLTTGFIRPIPPSSVMVKEIVKTYRDTKPEG